VTVLHVLNICTFYCDSRRYFPYIVRCPSSHYGLYATLISSLMMMVMLIALTTATQ